MKMISCNHYMIATYFESPENVYLRFQKEVSKLQRGVR